VQLRLPVIPITTRNQPEFGILSVGVTAAYLSVADDPSFNQAPLLRVKSITMGVDLWPLVFSRKLYVTGLTIDQPEIALVQFASGEWNFSSSGAKSSGRKNSISSGKAGLDVSLRLVKISGGRLSLGKTNRNSRPRVLEKVNVALRAFSATSVFPFCFSASVVAGGEINLQRAGPIPGAIPS
jgi:uncharacterized protein involved in outer membrane biogenesis